MDQFFLVKEVCMLPGVMKLFIIVIHNSYYYASYVHTYAALCTWVANEQLPV